MKLKIPSGFFENMSLIPSSLPLHVELTLAPSANMLIQRAAHASGDGNQSTTDNIKLARYRIDTTKTFLEVTYYKLPDGTDDKGNVIEGEPNAQAEFEAQKSHALLWLFGCFETDDEDIRPGDAR